MRRMMWCLLATSWLVLSTGCGDDDHGHDHGDAAVADAFVLAGRWASDYGSIEEIGSHAGDTWSDDWVQTTLVEFDNAARVAIRQNAADDEYNPSKYSRVLWTDFDEEGGFWYCSIALGLDTLEEARDSTLVADESDVASGGCNDFPWTYLVPAAPDAGT